MILLVVEHTNGKVSKSTWEMVTAARQLTQDAGREAPITALVLGSNIAPIAAQIAHAVDQVLVADLPALAQYDPELWSAAVAQIATEGEASVILEEVNYSGGNAGPAHAQMYVMGTILHHASPERQCSRTNAGTRSRDPSASSSHQA